VVVFGFGAGDCPAAEVDKNVTSTAIAALVSAMEHSFDLAIGRVKGIAQMSHACLRFLVPRYNCFSRFLVPKLYLGTRPSARSFASRAFNAQNPRLKTSRLFALFEF
jgi:hypothetical protein